MAYVGCVLVVHADERLNEFAFERYLKEWTRGIDLRPPDARAAAFYDVSSWTELTAMRRRKIGELLKSREEILRKTTRAWALSTPSSVVRGMFQAIFWIAPPKFPHRIVDTSRAAFAFIEQHLPEVDGVRVDREYRALLDRHAGRLGGAQR